MNNHECVKQAIPDANVVFDHGMVHVTKDGVPMAYATIMDSDNAITVVTKTFDGENCVEVKTIDEAIQKIRDYFASI